MAWFLPLVPVSAKDRDDVVAVLDFEDFARLDGRKLSLGSHGYAQMRDAELLTLVHRRVHAASDYRGVYPNSSRWSPLTTVSTEPGLQAGSRDLP
jgi:hypothetical protein